MIDEVQKIREEVERMHNLLPIMDGNNIYLNYADRICTTLKMYIDSLQEEPVSEDLIEELKKIVNIRECVSQGVPVIKIASHFAEWQKEQFEKNRLKHCDSITKEQAELEQGFIDQHLDKNKRMPTFLDAIEYGMQLQKEQMMKDAVEATVKVDSGGYPYVDRVIELYDYDKDIPLAKEGDKVKIVIIRNEEG